MDRSRRRLIGNGFRSLPTPAAWMLQTILWLHWLLWSGWRSTVLAWQQFCQSDSYAVYANGGSRARLLGRLLVLAIVHGVPTVELARLRLWDDLSTDRVLTHVFSSEVPAFHYQRSVAAGLSGNAPLADKALTSQLLAAAAIPTVTTTRIDRVGTARELLERQGSDVIIKPNQAAAGRGVVRLRSDTGRAEMIDGRPLGGTLERVVADRLDRFGDVIACPYVPTHPAMHGLGASADEALVVRLITIDPLEPRVDLAFAQIPWPPLDNGDGWYPYVTAEVLHQGVLGVPLPREHRSVVIAPGTTIPNWSKTVDAAIRAHSLIEFSQVYAIAWDIVVGPEGPVILEGNISWSLAPVQQLRGPLLLDDWLPANKKRFID